VAGCQTIANGGTCEARTQAHGCLEQGILVFECPDIISGSSGSWSRNLSLGARWGPNAYFSVWSSSVSGRSPNLQRVSGGFDVKCRVCGLALPPSGDLDSREGHVSFTLEFGPNVLAGAVDESGISGYALYLVGSCHERLSPRLAFVSKAAHGYGGQSVPDACSCPRSTYSVQIAVALPSSHLVDGLPNGEDVRLMVAPVTLDGYELPMGMTTAILQDYFTTATTTGPTTTGTAGATEGPAANASTTGTTTTATTTVVPLAIIRGSLELEVASTSAAAFVADPRVSEAVAESLTNLTGIPAEYISVGLSLISRRLGLRERIPRLLSTARVRADYNMTLPAEAGLSASNVTVATAALSDPGVGGQLTTLLNQELEEKVGAGLYTVTVTHVAAPTVQLVSLTTTVVTTTTTTEGPDATVPVAATLSVLAVLGGGGGVLWYLKRSRDEEEVIPLKPGDVADEALESHCVPEAVDLRTAGEAAAAPAAEQPQAEPS